MTVANIDLVQILVKRGNTSHVAAYVGPIGELVLDTQTMKLYIQDGVNPGGQAVSNVAAYLTGYAGNITANWVTSNVGSFGNVYSSGFFWANGTPFSSGSGGGGGSSLVNGVYTVSLSGTDGSTSFPGNILVLGNANIVGTITGQTISSINANLGTATTNITTLLANAGVQAVSLNSINANLGAYELYANANLGTATTNITNLQSGLNLANANVGAYELYANTQINSINANLGAFELYANANLGTATTNVTNLQAGLNLANVNVGAFETYANTQINTINANLGAFELYANANLGTATVNITALQSGIAASNANVGAFETYANTQINTINANLGAFELYANANLGTATVNITALQSGIAASNANVGAYELYANTQINSINANLGAFELYANANLGTATTNITTLLANAGTQQTQINSLQTGANANTAALLVTGVTYIGNLSTPNVLISGGYISSLANATIVTTGITNETVTNFFTSNARIAGGYATGLANIGVTGTATVGNVITTSGVFWGNGVAYSTGGGGSFTGGYVAGQSTFGSNLIANSATTSTSTTTGALVVVGGAGVSGNVNSGAVYSSTGYFWSNGAVYTGSSGTSAGGIPNQIQVNSGGLLAGANLFYYSANNAIAANSGIISTTPTSGALQILGGIGATGNINAGGFSVRPNLASSGTEVYGYGAYDNSTATVSNNTIIGGNAAATLNSTLNTNQVIIGAGALSTGGRNVVIGQGAQAIGCYDSTVLGDGSSTSGAGSILIGSGLNNSSQNGVIIGSSINISGGAILNIGSGAGDAATHQDSGLLGWGMGSTQAGELTWGSRRTANLTTSFRLVGTSSTQFTAVNQWRVNTSFSGNSAPVGFTTQANFSVYDSNSERVYMSANATGSGVTTTIFGPLTTGNLITTNGVFWSNGAPYSSGGGGAAFTGGYVPNQSTFGSNLVANSATTSTSTTTGALVVIGGVGVSGNIINGGAIQANSGFSSLSTYNGPYVDGIVVDYLTGNGRISAGAADGINFFNNWPTPVQLLSISATGNVSTSGNLFTGAHYTSGGYFWANGAIYTGSSGSAAGGSPGQIQFNQAGLLAGANVTYFAGNSDVVTGGNLYVTSGLFWAGNNQNALSDTVSSISSSQSLTGTNRFIIASGTITLTLPLATATSTYKYNIKNAGTGQITVNPSGTQLIDGQTSMIILNQYSVMGVLWDGAMWRIF